ncbi:hypothetical protein [Caldisphaera sp.]|nr:hypothetical protein [Caldisphaera sp.]
MHSNSVAKIPKFLRESIDNSKPCATDSDCATCCCNYCPVC